MRGPGEETFLRELAVRAATLWERMEGPFVPEPSAEGRALALERLGRWREKAAGGRQDLFERRLAGVGVSPERAQGALGCVRLEGPLPAWTQTFARALDAARRPEGDGARRWGLPFEEVLAPFCRAALSQLEPEVRAPFTHEAFECLVGDLLGELSYTSAPTLQEAFLAWRAGQGDVEPSSRKLYDAFTARLLAGGLEGFFSEYPVLARLLSRLVEQWVLNASAFARALREDRPEMERLFAEHAPVGRVVALKLSLSDRHHGGRCVARVDFEGGLRLFYKPRGLGIEKAWYELLEQLNDWGADLRVLRVLDRGDRGWAEPAVPAPCADAGEARRFYVRSGMLLAALYALEASDCFYENLIASGAYPVLIDMEALMHPVPGDGPAPALEPAHDLLLHSVLRAGLLPLWDVGPGGECVDISGLGATAGQVTSYLKRRWWHVNTDAMALEHERIRVETEDHLPRLGDRTLRVSDYVPELVEGFQGMYRLLASHRKELLAPEGPVRALGAQPLRVI
ncbi:MAG: type 2 lanthipeptide synthetase LanM, partial [Cystobacter sp.]